MSEGIEVIGEEDVIRALRHLADAARDLEPAHQAAGQLLLARANTQVPRQSGRLAASGRVDAGHDETSLVYDAVYAGVIHNGWPDHNIAAQPWAAETVDDSTTAVLDVFVAYFDAALHRF